MTAAIVEVSNARGESIITAARRLGSIGGITVNPDDTDQEILDKYVLATGETIDTVALAAQVTYDVYDLVAIPPVPAVIPATASSFFGQESCDKLTDTPARGITLPANALLMPDAGTNWYCYIIFRTGDVVANGTTYEVLASTGSTIITGSSSNRAIALYERAVASPANMAWKFQAAINNSNRDLLTGLSPALTAQDKVQFGDWCILIGVRDGIPHYAATQVGVHDALPFTAKASSVAAFDSFHFPAATTGDTIQRTSNLATITRVAGVVGTLAIGDRVLVNSSDTSFNGIQTLTGKTGTTISFASTGVDTGTVANPTYAEQRTPVTLFNTLGRLETAVASDAYGWGGGISRVEMRYGDLPLTGSDLDLGWFQNVANQSVASADLPGTKHYASSLSPVASYAADGDGTVSSVATAIGSVQTAAAIGASWLHLDPWPHEMGIPTKFGTNATRECEIGFDYLGAPGGIMGRVVDSTGAVVMTDRLLSSTMRNGRGVLILPEGIPAGVGYELKYWWAANDAYIGTWKMPPIKPRYPVWSQSTGDVLFKAASTGGTRTPVATTIGYNGIGGVASGLGSTGTNPTDAPGDWCRFSNLRTRYANQAGDGMIACADTIATLRNSAFGTNCGVDLLNITRSGHAMDMMWTDRKRWVNLIGTASVGGTLSGNWTPHPMYASTSPVWTKTDSVNIYRGGTWTLGSDGIYTLTGGTLVGQASTAGVVSGGVTGTYNHDTGAYSITDPIGGTLYISGEMEFDSQTGSTATRQPSDGFTCFGHEDIDDSGHLSNLLKTCGPVTAVVTFWANYLLSWASSRSQAEINAKVAFDLDMVRRRFESFPSVAGVPWLVLADPRTTSTSSIGEHKLRVAMREYGLNNPDTYWGINAINAEMDGVSNSPHFGTAAASGQLVGITIGHAVCKIEGVTGAKADEVFLTNAVRSVDGTTIDLTFNNASGNLTNSGGEVEGLYWGTVAGSLSLLDTATHTVTITSANTVRVVKDSGTWAATTYWNYGVGYVFPYSATAGLETAQLAKMLVVDTGGYEGIRLGSPVSFTPYDVVSIQA